MKTLSIAALVLATGTGFAMAETAIDANEDGQITMEELVAVHDGVSTDTFSQADTDDNGTLSAEELTAAQEAGLIPTDM
ncbi:hypothetical protein [Aliiroseovarius crassostreae]|uniref:hypothetical protein n=1 Tax=Aliiroseovarius crassostreae TaxID=154981 RepID=UPI003C7A1685